MLLLGRTLLILNGVLFVAIGVYGLWAPHYLAADLGIELVSSDGVGEFSATYGGLLVALGLLLLITLRRHPREDLLLLAVLYAGLAVGRLTALAMGEVLTQGWVLGWDVGNAILAVLVWRSLASGGEVR